ncbi:phosphatase domain-containing protein [Nocardia gipuzkoensis]
MLTRGWPGSGKTTYARQWVAEQPNRAKAPSRDDLRAALFDGEGVLSYPQEDVITAVQESAVRALLQAGRSTIVDDTNLRANYAQRWANLADKVGAGFHVIDIHTDLATCLARNESRRAVGGRYVDPRAVEGIARRFPIAQWKPFEPKAPLLIEPYVRNVELPPAWLVDVDGTIAHMTGRGPFDWHRVGEDEPDEAVIEALNAMQDGRPDAHMLVVSGRSDICKPQTRQWIRRAWTDPDALHMRKHGDVRPDSVIKLEIFNEHIRDHYNVLGVFDDRNTVVAMWRQLGLKCFQVAEGNF